VISKRYASQLFRALTRRTPAFAPRGNSEQLPAEQTPMVETIEQFAIALTRQTSAFSPYHYFDKNAVNGTRFVGFMRQFWLALTRQSPAFRTHIGAAAAKRPRIRVTSTPDSSPIIRVREPGKTVRFAVQVEVHLDRGVQTLQEVVTP
jgi:hypothetical protein